MKIGKSVGLSLALGSLLYADFVRDNSLEVVNDTSTNLIWQDNKEAATVEKDWSDAKEYCANLTLAGYSDWYLPTIHILESIVDKSNTPKIKSSFQNVASDQYSYYWSSSNMWLVNFDDDGSSNFNNKTYSYYVRCVRGGQYGLFDYLII
jgi:hypothetical protein